MINSNSISTEAAAGTNHISLGKQKGSTEVKTLFSSLLGMLQKGSSKKGISHHAKQTTDNTPTLASHGSGQQKNTKQHNLTQTVGKNVQHILTQTAKEQVADKKLQLVLSQTAKGKTTNKSAQQLLTQAGKEQAADKKLQLVLSQTAKGKTTNKSAQQLLTQAGKEQAADKKLQLVLSQTGKAQAADKNVQQVLSQADKEQTSLKQNTHVDASDAIASLQDAPSTPLAFIPNGNDGTVGNKKVQINPSASQATTQNLSPEPSTDSTIKKDKLSQQEAHKNATQSSNNLPDTQPNKLTEQTLTTQQSKQSKQLEQQSAAQQIATQQNNKTTSGSEQSTDGIKTSQATIAAIQQRNSNQAQQKTSNHASAIAAANNSSAIKMASSENSSSSQQDLNFNQRDADMSLLDASKADSKSAKGLDFQAQLAYKSQRTFTPADTMLEIVKSAKTGNTTLELQLEPANLGKVHVSIQIDQAKHIQVVFTVDQAASKQALEQQMPQLRLAMAQQGLDLSGFSMQMNQQGGQQGGNQHASSRTATDNNLNTTTLTNTNDEQHTRMGINLAAQGHISILA